MARVTRHKRSLFHGASAATFALGVAIAVPAMGQPEPARPAPDPKPMPAPPGQPALPPGGQPSKGPSDLGPGETDEKKPDPLATALTPAAGGLTLDGVAKEASETSPALRSKEADLEAGRGQSEQALVQFFPKVTLTASYTRLSDINPPSLGGALVGTANPGAVTIGPCISDPAAQCLNDSKGSPARAVNLSFPVILDNVSFTAGLVVPVSDYFLRTAQGYSAAEHNEQALKLQVDAQNLQTAADAKITYLTWIQARGQTVVAHLSVDDAEKQVADGKVGVTVGTASPADEMRLEARLAQAQFQEADARSVEAITEQRLRTTLHSPPERQLTIGVDVLAQPAEPTLESLNSLIDEGIKNRLEIQALDEQRASLDEISSATTASYLPRLDAFADATLADPNQRIFPAESKFFFTWDLGLRLTWTVNDTFSNLGAKRQANAHTAGLAAQRDALADAVRVEVTSAYADVAKSGPSIEAADRGVAAAEETLRVTKKLFAFGKATGTQVVDAETDLTSARLRKLSAHVNLIGAKIRLEHAIGRDMPRGPRLR